MPSDTDPVEQDSNPTGSGSTDSSAADADAPESNETVASAPATPDEPESPVLAPASSADDPTPSDGSPAPNQADPIEQGSNRTGSGSTDADAPDSNATDRGEGPAANPDVEGDASVSAAPTDPCEARAALAGRLAEIAEDARRAEAFRDREALEAAAGEYAEALRAIGLADVEPDVQPRVMARVRDRPGSAVSMPGDWPWWRELICQLEVLQAALANFDDVASRLGGRGAATRQELMRLRKESCWILGSERAEAASLRDAITRLRRNLAADCLAAQPSKEEQAQVEAIRAWLLLDASASPGGGEGRFDPPGGPARSDTAP